MKWIHRDDHRPRDGQEIVISCHVNEVYTGCYLAEENEISSLDGYIKWEAVLAWCPVSDFPFPKEEDFE